VGGTLEAFYFAFGDDDVIILCDMPDHASAAAVSLAAGTGGGVSGTSTTVLLSPEEIDRAAAMHPGYPRRLSRIARSSEDPGRSPRCLVPTPSARGR
jgi:hypothetical protein